MFQIVTPMKKFLLKSPVAFALIISFLVLFVSIGYVRYQEFQNLKKTSKSLDKLTGIFENRQELLSHLLKDLVFQQSDFESVMYNNSSTGADSAINAFNNNEERINKTLSDYRKLLNGDDEKKMLDTLQNLLLHIRDERHVSISLLQHGDLTGAQSRNPKIIRPLYDSLQQLNFRIINYSFNNDFEKGDAIIDNMLRIVKYGKNMTYFIAGLLVILGVIILNAARIITKKNYLLKKSEQKYRAFAEQTHEIIDRVDAKGRIIYSNKKLKNLLGYSDEELSRLTVFDLISEDFVQKAKENFLNPDKNLSKTHIVGKLKCRDGRLVDVEGDLIWEFRNKRFDGATSFLNDVTDRNRLQNSLKQSEQRFRQLFDMAPIPMFTVDPATFKFTLVNNACINHYGYSREEFMTMNLMQIRPKEDISRTASAIAMIIEEGWHYNDFHKHISKSGEVLEMEVFASRILIDNNPLVLTTAVDITERKLYENKVTRAIIKTQEDERYEIGGELHDNVCQILAAAKMNLGAMKHSVPDNVSNFYNQAVSSVLLATEEARNLSHRLAPVFLKDGAFKDSLERLLNTFRIADVPCYELYFDPELEGVSLSLELQRNLYRICQEGLRNANRYAQATEIKLEVTRYNENLVLVISDNGIGFDTKKTPSGIGLGNMKRRTELFSGRMDITSSPGNGCEIMITIPMKNSERTEQVS